MTESMAMQFALMLQAGMPVDHIMSYFLPDATEGERRSVAAGWLRSRVLAQAIKELNGADWEKMSLDQRMQKAIDKHYSELAYFAWTHNYSDVGGQDRTKLDIARGVLETRLAGLAGKMNPLESFWNDLKAGRVQSLGSPGKVIPELKTLPS